MAEPPRVEWGQSSLTGLQPAIVRGLYGYDTEGFWCEQPHAIIFRGRRRIDGQRVLVKLLRDPGSTAWGEDWLQRDYRIAQWIAANCVVKPSASEQTDLGPALIYADEGARPLEEFAAKAPLDIDTVLTIGASIAEAVAALHKERLIHCNLNPTTSLPLRAVRRGPGSVRQGRGGDPCPVGFPQVADHYFYRGLAAAVASSDNAASREAPQRRYGTALLACISLPPTVRKTSSSTSCCSRPKRHG